jgi:transposase
MNKKTESIHHIVTGVHYVAIDVSKSTLQVQDDRCAFVVGNDSKGHRKLLDYLKTCPGPLVVFEASGGYERALLHSLHKVGMPLAMVNPARVRDFARSEGVRAKTDPIDGKMILAFAKSKALSAMETPSEACLKLAALLDRRGHLVEQLAREKNRLQNSEAFIHRSIKRMIKVLEKEIATMEEAIEKLAASDPALKARSEIIQSVKGVGKITAWTILAYLSEIVDLTRNRLVALAGIAPFNRDSGKFSGRRTIQGGRAKVRKCLYMSAHTAATCNPVIAPYVQRLRDRGKPYKCAIVAAMRKLLIHIQSLMKKAQLSPCS